MTETCGKCRFWRCGGEDSDGPYDWGRCHLKQPQVFQKTKDISEGYQNYCTIVTDGYTTRWPITYDNGFCGEWEAKV